MTSSAVAPRETSSGCLVCGDAFIAIRAGQTVCGLRCATRLPKLVRKAAAADRRETRERLESMKSLAQLRKEAQAAFNAFIRVRDRRAGHGCICCGAPLEWDSGRPGGAVDAGHFVSRGAAIELAFDERNVNAQRKSCNRPGGTTRARFTAGMVLRYGAEVVAELEAPHPPKTMAHDELREIRDTYRRKARAIEQLPVVQQSQGDLLAVA